MTISKFSLETNRKEQLLTLLEEHESVVKFRPQDKTLKYGFYDRVFNGVAKVTNIGKSSLHLKREDGRPLGVLMVTPEIAALSKKEDHLMTTLGHRSGQWHLIRIQMIGSQVKNGSGEQQMHLSVSMESLASHASHAESISRNGHH